MIIVADFWCFFLHEKKAIIIIATAIDLWQRNVTQDGARDKMLEDAFPAAEKILSDLDNVLKKDPNLQSFEIIPVEDNENRSPVRHEHRALGLASWCVKPLFSYAYNRLLELRRNNRQKREDPATVSKWLQGALLLNPEINTFWNMRRDLIKHDRLEALPEFHFADLVIYHKPKCFEAFSYRRWLLKFVLTRGDFHVDIPRLLQEELQISVIAAERYANNCHAWSHREHMILMTEEATPAQFYDVLKQEWEASMKWCERHVSDSSGFAYRQFLLKKLLLFEEGKDVEECLKDRRGRIFCRFMGEVEGRVECREMIERALGNSKFSVQERDYVRLMVNLSYWMEECLLNRELVNLYPGHEALWYHRRYLGWSLTALITSYKRFSQYRAETFDPKFGISPRLGKNDCFTPLEVIFQEHNREIVCNAKSLAQHQEVLASSFVKFLKTLNLELRHSALDE